MQQEPPEVTATIRVWGVIRGAGLLIELDDGRSAVVPVLRDYIAHAHFDGDGLRNVSYVPMADSYLSKPYEQVRSRVDQLRSMVAEAVERSAFKLRSEEEAVRLANSIRQLKRFDPTLGLYAAYAFYQFGAIDGVVSVAEYMARDLGAEFADVRVFGARARGRATRRDLVSPYPVFSKTWSLLNAQEHALPPHLPELRRFLCASLWTTFDPKGTEALKRYAPGIM